MKAAIFGRGIGQRHLSLMANYFHPGNKAAFISHPYNWEEIADNQFDIAFICNPTYLHIDTAIKCAELGCHLFIEKPLDCKTDGLDELLDIVKTKNLSSYVAYPLRFHPEIKKLRAQIPQGINRANIICQTDLRKWGKPSYSYKWDEGAGAILELSHEIDYARYLFGEIVELEAICSDWGMVTNDADDRVILYATHESGFESKILLNLKSNKEERQIILGSTFSNIIRDIKPNDNIWLSQLKYFFDNIDNPRMMNNLFDASKLFRNIIQAREGLRNEHPSYNTGTGRQ